MFVTSTKRGDYMTIDEAITHCIEVAEQNEDQSCKKCANEHRQLAEWLRELEAYRKAENEIEQELVNWNDIDNGKCRGLFLATSIIQHYKNAEVNADDSN